MEPGGEVDANCSIDGIPSNLYLAPTAVFKLNGVQIYATAGGGTIPAASDVRFGVAVGSGSGTCYVPAAADVRHGTDVDATTGTCYVPTASQTLYGINVDATTGNVTLPNADGHTPDASLVLNTAHFGVGNATVGTAVSGGGGLTTDEHDWLSAVNTAVAANLTTPISGVADAVMGSTVEGMTFVEIVSLMASVLLGKSSNSGATFRDVQDTKNSVVAIVDSSSNRIAVTLNP